MGTTSKYRSHQYRNGPELYKPIIILINTYWGGVRTLVHHHHLAPPLGRMKRGFHSALQSSSEGLNKAEEANFLILGHLTTLTSDPGSLGCRMKVRRRNIQHHRYSHLLVQRDARSRARDSTAGHHAPHVPPKSMSCCSAGIGGRGGASFCLVTSPFPQSRQPFHSLGIRLSPQQMSVSGPQLV